MLSELVEEEVNNAAGGYLEKAKLSKQVTDKDRSLNVVCGFALKFCWLKMVLKYQDNQFGIMTVTLRASRLVNYPKITLLYLNQT